MTKEKTVIFIDYIDSLSDITPLIRKLCGKEGRNISIVSSNIDMAALKGMADEALYYDEILSDGDYRYMDGYVFELAQSWHTALDKKEEVTEYKGISFGSIIEEKAQRFFTYVVKRAQIILAIAERFKPGEIILISEDAIFADYARFIYDELNIPASFIKIQGRRNSFKRIKEAVRDCITGSAVSICDSLIKDRLLRTGIENAILVDSRLYRELKGIEIFNPCLYLIECGLRIRLDMLSGKRPLYAPVTDLSGAGRRLFAEYWKAGKLSKSLKAKFDYKTKSLWTIVEKRISGFVEADFSRVADNIMFLEALYARLKPRCIVLREAVREPEKTIVSAARLFNIPTLVIQHGLLAEPNVYTKLHAGCIALWGKAGIEWYKGYGNEKAAYVVTGKPQHDSLYVKMREENQPVGQKRTILYIGDYYKHVKERMNVYMLQDSERRSIAVLLDAMKSFPGVRLIIKMHPFDLFNADELLAQYKFDASSGVSVVKNGDIDDLIMASSLVITSFFSSAALDAVIAGKPLISLNYYKQPDLIPFAGRQVALGVNKPGDLKGAIRRIFADKSLNDTFTANRDKFIYDYAYKVDGQSTARVIDLITKICANKDVLQSKERNILNEYTVNQSIM